MGRKKPNVWDCYTIEHVEMVWQYLSKQFGFPLGDTKNRTGWKTTFKEYLERDNRGPYTGDVAFAFLVFGTSKIDPILNSLLLRHHQSQTFHSLVMYVISTSAIYKEKVSEWEGNHLSRTAR